MTFYQSCLGGELEFSVVNDTPMAAQMPAEMQDKIMHSSLVAGDVTIMASDMLGSEAVTKGNIITLCLVGDSLTELQKIFDLLAEGGEVTHQLKQEFWGDVYGDLFDRFGVRWMFNANQQPASA